MKRKGGKRPVGQYVKVRFRSAAGGERMWVKVKSVRGGKICGRLANTPVITPVKRGARVCFGAAAILDISKRGR